MGEEVLRRRILHEGSAHQEVRGQACRITTYAYARRDSIDRSRKTSPLVRMDDAVFIDSSDLTVNEMVAIALKHLAERGLKPTAGQIPG